MEPVFNKFNVNQSEVIESKMKIWRDLLFHILDRQVFAINFEFHGVHGQQTRWSLLGLPFFHFVHIVLIEVTENKFSFIVVNSM